MTAPTRSDAIARRPGRRLSPLAVRSAVASTALAPVLRAGRRPGRIIAVVDGAIHLAVTGAGPLGLLALEPPGAVRLPNALELSRPVGGVTAGEEAEVGAGVVVLAGWRVRVDRWFDPRPRLGPATLEGLEDGLIRMAPPVGPSASGDGAPPAAPPWWPSAVAGFAAATRRLDADEARLAADRLLGLGPGLTPAGDDVLAGFLVAARTLPSALPDGAVDHRLGALADAVAEAVLEPAASRTTAVSAALLAHAGRSGAPAPLAAWLAALTGRGGLGRARARLHRVGHSSGPALAAGADLAVRALLRAGHPPGGDGSAGGRPALEGR